MTERETVFVCCACGKRSKDRFGYEKIDRGWDESCMLNSVEAYVDSLTIGSHGFVTGISEGGIIPEASHETD